MQDACTESSEVSAVIDSLKRKVALERDLYIKVHFSPRLPFNVGLGSLVKILPTLSFC